MNASRWNQISSLLGLAHCLRTHFLPRHISGDLDTFHKYKLFLCILTLDYAILLLQISLSFDSEENESLLEIQVSVWCLLLLYQPQFWLSLPRAPCTFLLICPYFQKRKGVQLSQWQVANLPFISKGHHTTVALPLLGRKKFSSTFLGVFLAGLKWNWHRENNRRKTIKFNFVCRRKIWGSKK